MINEVVLAELVHEARHPDVTAYGTTAGEYDLSWRANSRRDGYTCMILDHEMEVIDYVNTFGNRAVIYHAFKRMAEKHGLWED